MGEKVTPLESHIFRPGTKFRVTDKTTDGTFGPGSTGFTAFVKGRDQDYPNVVYLSVSMIRRGKSGKNRLDRCEISTPIFDFEDEHLPKIMPNEKRRYYVHVEALGKDCSTVLNMKDMDFLGWAYAQALYVYKLSSRAKHYKPWPQSGDDLLNRVLNLPEYYAEDSGYVRHEYCNTMLRETFVRRLRMIEAMLAKCGLAYMSKISDLESGAAYMLYNLREEDGPPVGNENILLSTLNFFSGKSSKLKSAYKLHGSKKNTTETLA